MLIKIDINIIMLTIHSPQITNLSLDYLDRLKVWVKFSRSLQMVYNVLFFCDIQSFTNIIDKIFL